MAAGFSSLGYQITYPLFADAELDAMLAQMEQGANLGLRNLLQQDWCAELAAKLSGCEALASMIPAGHVAVQCTAFVKAPEHNWLVPLHQDLSIPVAERIEHPAVTGWSQKDGVYYVQPPIAVLQELVAVRLQLDPCSDGDGGLRVVPGSHLGGRLSAPEAMAIRELSGEAVCQVPRGAALVLRPLLLHASSKLKGDQPRRVLHFLYGPSVLPCGLRWWFAR